MASLPSCDGGALHASPQLLPPHRTQQTTAGERAKASDRRGLCFHVGRDARRRPVAPIRSKETGHPYPFDENDPLITRFPRWGTKRSNSGVTMARIEKCGANQIDRIPPIG